MIYKLAHNAKWLLLFKHVFSIGSYMTKEEAESSNSPGKYSILQGLTNYSKYNHVYEFLIEYPNSTVDYLWWTQTANPVNVTEIDTTRESLGTQIKHCIYKTFRGLARSNHASCFMDGDGNAFNDFWFAIGVYKKWVHVGIPGPIGIPVDEVQLWMRVPWERTCFINYYPLKSFVFLSQLFLLNTNK